MLLKMQYKDWGLSMIETELRAYLLNDPDIKRMIGNRMYPLVLPEKAAFPAIAYTMVSKGSHHLINIAFPRIQFSCFSPSYMEAKNIAGKIREALQRYKGQMGSNRVIQGVFENEYEMYEKDTGLYHVACDIKIIFRED